MFIDLHIHTSLWKGFPRKDGSDYLSVREVEEIYNKYHIRKGVLLPLMSPECRRKVQSNEEILEICKNNKRFIPFCNIDPRMLRDKTRIYEYLEYYKDLGCKGIGEFTAHIYINNKFLMDIFKSAEELNLPFLSHFSQDWNPEGYYGIYAGISNWNIDNIVRKFKDLIFIGHSKAFWNSEYGTINELDELFETYPNLHGDLSAVSGYSFLKNNESEIPEFLEKHQDQLHFGTDLCKYEEPKLCKLLLRYRDEHIISQKVFNKISRENTLKLLK